MGEELKPEPKKKKNLSVIEVPLRRLSDDRIVAKLAFYGISVSDFGLIGRGILDDTIKRKKLSGTYYAIAEEARNVTSKAAPPPYAKPKPRPREMGPSPEDLYSEYVAKFHHKSHGL